MSDMKAAREAAAEAMTVALNNAADLVYWWDEADRQIISGGEPEWTEYAGGVKLVDRFDLQAIANAAIDAYLAAIAAMPPSISPELIDKLNKLATYLTEQGEYEACDLIDTVVERLTPPPGEKP